MVIKSYLHFTTLSLALSLDLAMSSSLPATALSQQTLQQHSPVSGGELVAQRRRRRLIFKVRGVGRSGNLQGGAARGSCSSQPIYITPLVPLTDKPELTEDGKQKEVEVYSALTVAARPKFFVHIPQISAQEAKFTLLKEINENQDEEVTEATVTLTGTPGVVSFSLPAEAPSLEVGQTYKWSVQVICDPNSDDASVNPLVKGEVQRIPSTPAIANIEQAAPIDRPQLYSDANAWYDSVTALAELLDKNPNDPTLKDEWVSLLRSVNLDRITEAPLVQCCTAKNE